MTRKGGLSGHFASLFPTLPILLAQLSEDSDPKRRAILGQHPFATGKWQLTASLFALHPYLRKEVLPSVTAEQQRRLVGTFRRDDGV